MRQLPATPGNASIAESEPSPEANVDVTELPRVGPYDNIVTVFSDESEALIDWLVDNGYVITEPMKPFVREYVGEGWGFLAVQLAPDTGINDIAPLKFTCPTGTPRIPLRLTAVAAEPQMDIRVYIAGDEYFQPLNYRNLALPVESVRFNPNTNSHNLNALTSYLVDKGGGALLLRSVQPQVRTCATQFLASQRRMTTRQRHNGICSTFSAVAPCSLDCTPA
ncbi:MAG: DUF2330 domain-containing protein [Deltaproteobacteria bacterium]|nr:DUF2330 domain-containing protein [Deltaproteobacteria bacterium]